MRSKKIKINDYDVFLIKTNKYTSIQMTFVFEMLYTRENIFKSDLLEEYMLHSSLKYKTRKEISIRKKELYSISTNLYNYNKGEKMFVDYNVTLVDPKLVKDDYLKEGLVFARDMLLKPNFEDGKLDHDELDRCKDNLTMGIKDSLLDKKTRAADNLKKIMFPNTFMTLDLVESESEYRSIIDSYSDIDLINMHEELFNNSLVGVILMGNIDDKALKTIGEVFKFKNTKKLDTEYNNIIKINKKTPFYNKIVDKNYNDSILSVVYETPFRGIKERLAYGMITSMLNESGLLIHNTLREELKLVYSAGARYNNKQKFIIINAFIDREKEEDAIKGIDMVLDKLNDRELVEQLLKKIKKENELDLYIYDENKWRPFNELYKLSFNFDISFKKKCSIRKKITSDDILKVLHKMKKVKIHFYEGAKEK